jgi:inner membrane protein
MEEQSIKPTPETPFWQRQAATLKGIVIFFLMLALMIPTFMIQDLIREREGRQQEAIAEVSGKWGQSQTFTGPVLVLPYEQIGRTSDGKELTRETKYAYFLPDQLNIEGQVSPEKRHRGIFDVVLYSTKLSLEGSFEKPAVEKLVPPGATVLWNKAVLALGIPDLRGLKDQVTLGWNGQNSVFEPGIPPPGVAPSGIHNPVPLQADAAGPHRFRIEVALKGSGSLFFTPVGKVTTVKLGAPWADPSFTGAFLPDEKSIRPDGFDASWKVLNLNRNYPQQWIGDQNIGFAESGFGVDFLLPVDNYQKATRSAKYAILFIGLTFLTVFFIEMRQSRRVHPFQYALIGLALVIFYTLLVSLSEHMPYNAAYAIAALMTVGLSAWYARALFDSGRMALLVGGALTLLYVFLFVVLQQQDYALLIGSFGLFLILGVIMHFSRKIEWQR